MNFAAERSPSMRRGRVKSAAVAAALVVAGTAAVVAATAVNAAAMAADAAGPIAVVAISASATLLGKHGDAVIADRNPRAPVRIPSFHGARCQLRFRTGV